MEIYQLPPGDVVASLKSSPVGPTGAEAERRSREFGPNRVEEVAREPLWLRLLKEFTQFCNKLILWGVIMEASLILWIAYTALGNRILGTAPMAGAVWLFVLPFAVRMLILEELRKWLAARWLPNSFCRSGSSSRPPRLSDHGSPKAKGVP